ncbi:MAG: hypothetical protein ACOX81_01905 [Candidatus Heteroscillospira sp.]|jgi:predicted NUDIX family phosphoesterase
MDTKTELVLAVPTRVLQPWLTVRGLITERVDALTELIMAEHVFLPRPEAELDPAYRQIIPYTVLIQGDRVFSTRRLRGGTEKRLHGLISLGIGGHINPAADGDGGDVLLRGLRREIDEEVFCEGPQFDRLSFRGFINDDSNDVGKVHLGLFCTMPVIGEVSVRETEKLEGLWLHRGELQSLAGSMETWSSLILDALFPPEADNG